MATKKTTAKKKAPKKKVTKKTGTNPMVEFVDIGHNLSGRQIMQLGVIVKCSAGICFIKDASIQPLPAGGFRLVGSS